MLAIGTPAPSFRLPDQNGAWLDLSMFRGRCQVVLFFYPKDGTAGCTREACAFRDAYSELQARNTVVIGVSGDDLASHARFAQRWSLPFHLVSDADGALRRAYGVKRTLGLWPGRVTYIIDKEGMILAALNDPIAPIQHVRMVLQRTGVQRKV